MNHDAPDFYRSKRTYSSMPARTFLVGSQSRSTDLCRCGHCFSGDEIIPRTLVVLSEFNQFINELSAPIKVTGIIYCQSCSSWSHLYY